MFLSVSNISVILKLSVAIVCVLFIICINIFVLAARPAAGESKSIYECGFDSFIDMNTPLEIHFYLVCLLYLLFDVELVLLVPYVVSAGFGLDLSCQDSLLNLFFVLILGYFIEYYSGVLSWVDFIKLGQIDGQFFA